MRKIAWLVLAVSLLSGCATFFPERTARRAAERDRIEHCKLTLPILRSEPMDPYRVVQLVEAYSETDLAWYACVEHADAVISTFAEDKSTSVTVGGGPYLVAGKSKTTSEAKFLGRAIKYDRPAPPARPWCVQTMPILRVEPTMPYRVLYTAEGVNDRDLAWSGCSAGADAIIATVSSDGAKLIGRAIRYEAPRAAVVKDGGAKGE